MADGLLLLHAFPLDATMWVPQVRPLAGVIPVVSAQFPGLGKNPMPVGEVTTMDAAAEAAFGAAERAGLGRMVVCGLSMGGYVAFSLWRAHGNRVAGLILANTRAGADDEAGKARRKALADRLRAEGNGFLVENPPPLLSAQAPGDLWAEVKASIGAQPAEALAAASLGMAERADSTGDLAGIDVPTLVITSAGDTLIPPEATAPMADQIPGARLAVIDVAGHLSSLEAPSRFNQLLQDHLRACGIE